MPKGFIDGAIGGASRLSLARGFFRVFFDFGIDFDIGFVTAPRGIFDIFHVVGQDKDLWQNPPLFNARRSARYWPGE